MIEDYILADRADAIKTASEWMERDFVVFDTETTGLDGKAEICEISVVDRNGSVLLDTLVYPTVSIPEDATAVHGITDFAVGNAPTIDELTLALEALFDGQLVLAYNVAYDLRVMRQSLMARKCSIDVDFETGCIMDLYARYHGEFNEQFRSYKWQSLGNAIDQCKVTVPGTLHRALADARGALMVLQTMAKGG